MVGTAFDPKVVETFIEHVEEFDRMIDLQDIQGASCFDADRRYCKQARNPMRVWRPTFSASLEEIFAFRSISEAQREVFALHEIAQTIGSSLNLSDTVTLVANKLRAIVPFDTCVIYLVDDPSGKAIAAHVVGEEVELFKRRRINIGDGITGWVIANSRSMCNASPDLDLVGIPDEVVKRFRGVLVSPLQREDGAFGAISLYSQSRTSYTHRTRASARISLPARFERSQQCADLREDARECSCRSVDGTAECAWFLHDARTATRRVPAHEQGAAGRGLHGHRRLQGR